MSHPVTRRTFLKTLAITGVVTTVRIKAVAAAQQIVVTDPGGDYQAAAARAYYLPFEKETGIKVVYAARPHYTLGKLKAMVEAGNQEWDVTHMVKQLVPKAVRDGLLEPIDWSIVDGSALIPAAVHSHAVGNDAYATLMAYSTKRYGSDSPKRWADFWDVQRFPGRRSMYQKPLHMLEISLLADGVSPDKLYPLDLDRAFKKLDAIKAHVHVWWNSAAQSAQLMLDGEVDMITGWNGRLSNAIEKGAPFRLEWNESVYAVECWVVPKGTRNREAAMQFLAFTTRPDRQAEFAKSIPYGPTNLAAYKKIPPERARTLPTHPENVSRMVPEDVDWLSTNSELINERWAQWFAGK